MHRLSVAIPALLLATPLLAQSSMTTPSGGLTAEGTYSNELMGRWPDMRVQLIDDTHSDDKTRTITEVAFRMDYRFHTSATAMGRTWSNITVDISHMTNPLSSNFKSNLGTSPTRVFDSKWSWPTQVGFPLLRPDAWGGAKGQLRFPFTKPWVYAAKKPLVTDYTFRGGVLANRGVWDTLTTSSFHLDSEVHSPVLAFLGSQLVPPTPPLCHDSALTASRGASTHAYGGLWSKLHPAPYGGRLMFRSISANTAPNASVLHALGLGGIPNGVNIGAGCNRLYVDFSKPVMLMSRTTQSYGYTDPMTWFLNWRSELAGLGLWLQAAWLDSTTRAFKLTAATHVTLPRDLPAQAPPRQWTFYRSDTRSTTGLGAYLAYAPYIRYKLE